MYVKNFGEGNRWLAGKVVQKEGAMMFRVKIEDGRMVRRHKDQVRHKFQKETVPGISRSSSGDSTLTVEASCFDMSSDSQAGSVQNSDLNQNFESANGTLETVDRSANKNSLYSSGS